MSLFSIVQGDAAEAQEFVAQMTGKAADGTNALYRGFPRTIVFGSPLVEVLPAPSGAGGYRRRVVVPATIVRVDLDGVPKDKEQITRTDITPQITYRIDSVDTHDPIRYNLVLVKLGE